MRKSKLAKRMKKINTNTVIFFQGKVDLDFQSHQFSNLSASVKKSLQHKLNSSIQGQ